MKIFVEITGNKNIIDYIKKGIRIDLYLFDDYDGVNPSIKIEKIKKVK